MLVFALALHLAEPGVVGLLVIVLATALMAIARKVIILDLDTWGGQVTAAFDIARTIKADLADIYLPIRVGSDTALLLAGVGVYGIMAFSVSQRTHEIGIRMALGADRARVRAMVLRQGLALTIAGILFGVLGSIALGGWLSSLVFEVAPNDPTVLIAVVAILALVAAAAGFLPTRRATSLDPIQALRKE